VNFIIDLFECVPLKEGLTGVIISELVKITTWYRKL